MARVIPHNQEAEQSVLGSIFLDPSLIRRIKDELSIIDFYDERHAALFKGMLALSESNVKIDYTTIASELTQMGLLKKAGGVDYIGNLAELVPSTANIDIYVDLVKDASLKRRIIHTAEAIIEKGYEGEMKAQDYIDLAEQRIFELSKQRKTSEFLKIDEVASSFRDKTELTMTQKDRGGVTGLLTGFKNYDSLTLGLQREELLILAARPSMGKSAFAMNLALNVAKKNNQGKAGVAIFSLEMSAEQLVGRMLSAESSVDNNKIKGGNLTAQDWRCFEAATETLSKLNIFFDDSAQVTVAEIRAKCRKLALEGNLDLVLIDYLQLIKGDAEARGNRQEEVARISRSLKQMARELHVPVVALSQLSREVEKREEKIPVMADLRESGSIEQDADIVMFLYRDDYYRREKSERQGEAELIIAKNRQGVAGVSLHFMFETQYSRFKPKKDEYEPTEERQ